jgi:hypothetical protein
VSAERAVALVFLAVSLASITWQASALLRLIRDSSLRSRASTAYGGLLRTAICRVGAATAYVFVGVNALWPQFEVVIFTLAVYSGTQVLWQLNSWADLHLAQRLGAPGEVVPPIERG